MKLVYDANFSINQHRGMGKYINNLVSVLGSQDYIEATGLLKGDLGRYDSDRYKSFGLRNYIFWEQISMFLFARKFNGIIIFPYNTASLLLPRSSRNVLIIHDLIYFENYDIRSLKQRVGALYRKLVVPRVVNRFENIITVSHHSKDELLKRFNIDSKKITVIPNTIEFDREEICKNPSLKDRDNFIFHIGGEPSYKNSQALLYAFYELPPDIKVRFRLKIVGIKEKGTLASFRALADKLGISNAVDFLPYQQDDEIKMLYQKAKMFVLPSFFEGFGIPIIESFKFGCPLLCSSSSCFPEIAGNGGLYFDPNEPKDLARAILETLYNEDQANARILQGYNKLNEYTFTAFENKVMTWFRALKVNK